ncbi:Calponin homology domain-containing proteinromo [Phytophthora infestans]|uniref:Calponin homology domain-containing proteinromo n=1 Tax=Phytophthora infestans TaxID=4787 RepID=A0A833SGZ0_PHYIN|nr:Calponin homology domain-containing proteinromo [Phytophthora infestans]KAF4137603.1 Chromo (CHRromatin Organization MOdifier) domain [Phytophthora infestans]
MLVGEEDGDLEYEVEALLVKSDSYVFVKWLGYSSDESTWEPEANLKLETVKRLRERLRNQRANSSAELESVSSESESIEPQHENASRVDVNQDERDNGSEKFGAVSLAGANVWLAPKMEGCRTVSIVSSARHI